MNVSLFIAALSPVIVLCGAAIVATAKMTRLVDAVDRLNDSMVKIVNRVDDHENRLTMGGL